MISGPRLRDGKDGRWLHAEFGVAEDGERGTVARSCAGGARGVSVRVDKPEGAGLAGEETRGEEWRVDDGIKGGIQGEGWRREVTSFGDSAKGWEGKIV